MARRDPIQIQRYDDKQADHYIVLLNDGVNKVDFLNWLTNLPNVLVDVTHNFDSNLLHGFTATFDKNALIHLCGSADVKSISEDGTIESYAIVEESELDFWSLDGLHIPIQVARQTNAPWGISRISQDGKEVYKTATDLTFTYKYNWPQPRPVKVYIVDDGIKIDHEEFEGRARWGKTFAGNIDNVEKGKSHGTRIAGIVGGKTFGVAKDVTLIAVKTTTKQKGFHSHHLKGLEWVWAEALSSGGPTIVNLSWGHEATHPPDKTPVDKLVTNMIRDGIHVVVAAGKLHIDVKKVTPARVPSAITVSASDINDYASQTANWGDGVDIFAPGIDIVSAGITSKTATETASGSSMAAPHVTGLVAYLISLYGNKTPTDMKAFLDTLCLKGVLNEDKKHPLNGSPNKLARNDVDNAQFQFGVTVTNTGSQMLNFSAGNLNFNLAPTEKQRLPISKDRYNVNCIELPSGKWSVIATIFYPSPASWEVIAGVVVKGAKFRSHVPMADTGLWNKMK